MRSYIQNVVFRADAVPADLEAELERAIPRRFGLDVPVVVRDASTWASYIAGNPYPEAAEREPNRLLLAVAKAAPNPDAVDRLRERAANGERIARFRDALWIHYPGGVAGSKLTPAVLNRLAGSPVTTRNWRTVVKLCELVRGSGPA